MNTNIMEKMGALLSDKAFYERYADISSAEDIVAVIQREVPDASREEIDAFLVMISKQLQAENEELSENDLDGVSGGVAVTLTVTGVCAVIKGAAIVGGAIGTIYWYYKHRNC